MIEKEVYLSNIEWTKIRDNIGGVKGDLIFKDNISYEEYIKILKETYFILSDKRIQSNWNSLKEYIEVDNKRAKEYIERIRTSDLCHGDYPVEYYYAEKRKEITDYYLDKMNELERGEK